MISSFIRLERTEKHPCSVLMSYMHYLFCHLLNLNRLSKNAVVSVKEMIVITLAITTKQNTIKNKERHFIINKYSIFCHKILKINHLL